MNALGTPAAAGPADTPRPPSDRRDWLKLAGGMMFASGVLVLLARKGGDWSKGAVFLALLVGAVVLLGLAFMRVVGAGAVGGPGAPGGPGAAGWRSRAGVAAGVELGGWRSAYAVFGTLLLLGALIQLVNVLGGRPQASLNLAWTFLVAGGVAVLTSFVLRAPFQMLLGALFGVVVWLSLWDKILSHPSGDTIRWLLLVLAAIYFGVAVWLSRAGRPQASDLVTVAGLAAVLAASLSFAAAAGALNGSFSSPLGSQVPKPSQGWNVFLLVISLVLIWWGARGPIRGPGYVGAVGLAAFISLTGSDLVHRLSASGGGGGVAGWPLILLIGGAILLAAGFVLSPGALGGLGGPGGPGGPGGGPGASGEPGGGGAYAAPGGGGGTPLQPQMAPPPQPGYAPPAQSPGGPASPGAGTTPQAQVPPADAPPTQPPQAAPPAGTPPPEQPTQIHPSPGGPDQPTAARPIQPPPDQPPPGAGPPAGQS